MARRGRNSTDFARRLLLDRLSAAGVAMRDDDLEALVAQAEAVIALRRN